ncbi:hypothetical protein M5K25_025468 [Dendrobium thyrsiflorum]|uniref:Vacuolar protein sorting-associated protein 29 n=1 Tax=Dendrobium thyrsiflorum TaxID=117978 RepID=A0ABD0U4B2_DENTH
MPLLTLALPLHLSSPGKSCMGDPDVDHGFLYDEQGRVDILQSPFFDVTFGNDRTADEYVNRIIYQLTLAIEDRIPQGRCSPIRFVHGSTSHSQFARESHDYLKSLCPDLHVSRGEYDEDARYSETKTLTIGQFKLGLCHGHQVVPWGDLDSLAMLQRQLDVDILVTGHTHQFKAYKHEGGVVINPGSATGAYSSITYDVNPSFVLMDIDGLRVVVYVYELIDGEVKVDKIDFKKTAPTQPAP